MPFTLPVKHKEYDEKVDPYVSAQRYVPTMGEGLSAKTSAGFRMTTTEMAMQEYEIAQAEKERYGAVSYDQSADVLGGIVERPLAGPEEVPAYKMTEEEWKTSPYFIEGVEWHKDFTEERARVIFEDYNERRYEDEIIRRRDEVAGFGEKALGFGASILGNLPDPINLVSFIPGGQTTLLGRVAVGAGEGLLGTALADAIVMPDLKSKGENIGFMDVVNDMIAGAVIGGGFGALGHGGRAMLDRYRQGKGSRIANEVAPILSEDIPEMADVIRAQTTMPVWMGEAMGPGTGRLTVSGIDRGFDDYVKELASEIGMAPGRLAERLDEDLPIIRAQVEDRFRGVALAEGRELGRFSSKQVPVYEAIRYAREPLFTADDKPIRSNRGWNRRQAVDLMGRETIKDIETKHPGIFHNEGVDLADATQFGFESAEDFLNKLADVDRISDAQKKIVDDYVAGYMAERSGDIEAAIISELQGRFASAADADPLVRGLRGRMEKILDGVVPRNATPFDYLIAKHAERYRMDAGMRRDLMFALEKAAHDVSLGKDVDVSSVIQSSGFYKKLTPEQKQSLDLRTATPEEVPVFEDVIRQYDEAIASGFEDVEVKRLADAGIVGKEDLVEYNKAAEDVQRVESAGEEILSVLECAIGAE